MGEAERAQGPDSTHVPRGKDKPTVGHRPAHPDSLRHPGRDEDGKDRDSPAAQAQASPEVVLCVPGGRAEDVQDAGGEPGRAVPAAEGCQDDGEEHVPMNNAQIVESRTTGRHPLSGEGAIPVSALHFRTGRRTEAEGLVIAHHYSGRHPRSSAVVMVASLHLDGGLFGGDGPMVAAAMFTIPATRWAEPVIELCRLVRGNNRVPLTFLLSQSAKELKRKGHDLLVSFADKTQGHEGIVYRAANWCYAGCRERTNDGIVIDGAFHPGRSCNSAFGTRSVDKLRGMFPHKTIEPHYDEGKHCYWLALGKRGEQKAERLGLSNNHYP